MAVPARRKRSAPAPMTLTTEEEQFLCEFLRTLNQSKAYMAVWPLTPTKDAPRLAATLMAKPHIKTGLERIRGELAERFRYNRERVLQEIAKAAFFDPRRLYNDDGTVKRPHEMDAETASAITGFETVEIDGGENSPPVFVRKVKWTDRLKALDMLIKVHGWYEQPDQGGTVNQLTILLQQIGQRSAIPVRQVIEVEADE